MLDEDKQREIQEELIRKSKIAREEAEQKAKDQAIQRKQNKMQMDNLKNEIESIVSGLEKRNDPVSGNRMKEQPSSKSSRKSKVSGASSSRQSIKRPAEKSS